MPGSDPPQPQLALSDIMHNMSPSPSIIDEHRVQKGSDFLEPLSEDDIARMRSRITDMGFALDSRPQDESAYMTMTEKEKELGSMVVKLLDSFIQPTQLLRQADFIKWLTAQRDLLVQSFEEERKRWEAERDGWTRMAEALLAQRANAAITSGKDEEPEHRCATYESENKALREKLQDAQSRYSSLESEITKFKPLLLMQPPLPFFSTQTFDQKESYLLDSSAGMDSGSKSSKGKRRDSTRTADAATLEDRGLSDSEGDTKQLNGLEHPSPRPNGIAQSQSSHSDHYRKYPAFNYIQVRSAAPNPFQILGHPLSRTSAQHTPARPSNAPSTTQTPLTHTSQSKRSSLRTKKALAGNLRPLSADARTEHLLLAARKIGRDRANLISGFMRRIEREQDKMAQEREAERLEKERLDRVAAETAGGGGNMTYYRKDLVDFAKSPGSTGSSNTLSTPKTPKRGTAAGNSVTHFMSPTLITPRSDLYPHQKFAPNSFVFVGTPTAATYGNTALATPRQSGHAAPATHSTIQLTQTSAVTPLPATRSNNPPTPLDSLLSAARSMMNDNNDDATPRSNVRRRGGAPEPPESPLTKKRRLGTATSSNGVGEVEMLGASAAAPSLDRVRSALDVLADQAAAAFNSDRRSPAPKGKSKVKGTIAASRSSTRDRVSSEEEMVNSPTPKEKTRGTHKKLSHSDVGMGNSMSTRSRTKALSTEPTKTLRNNRARFIDGPRRVASTPRIISPPRARLVHSPRLPLEEGSVTNTIPTSEPVPFSEETDGTTSTANNTALTSAKEMAKRRLHASQSNAPAVNGDAEEAMQPLAVDSDMATVEEDEDADGENDSDLREGHGAGAEQDAEDEEAGAAEGDMTEQLQADRPSSGEGHDTDADAEGEMDVDAEDTVVVNASAAHGSSIIPGPLSLTLPSPPSEKRPTSTPDMNDSDRNVEEPRVGVATEFL